MMATIEVFWGDEPEVRSAREFLTQLKADGILNVSATWDHERGTEADGYQDRPVVTEEDVIGCVG